MADPLDPDAAHDASSTHGDLGRAPTLERDLDAAGAMQRITSSLFGIDLPRVCIGRFTVLERVGAGGMGIVYAAYDPELDRRVALKIIRARGEDGDAHNRSRLLREARVLARITDPNVVPVYDVGTHGDDVFVAMEFVEGTTLDAWVEARVPPWRERLRMLIAVGRGVAAAHAAGIVHRDLKPQNVLVGRDDRPRVADFGLAGGATTSEVSAAMDPAAVRDATQPGLAAGTPGYIAPETLTRSVADAASDQFSFCVTAWEALYGARPFAGRTMVAYADRLFDPTDPKPPADSPVPTAIARILVTGMARDPGERHPSMAVLLARLERVGRGRVRLVYGSVGALGIAGAFFGGWLASGDPTAPCAGTGSAIDGVWNDEARHAIASAYASSDLPFAAAASQRVDRELSQYADHWATQRASACRSARIERDESEDTLSRRNTCFDRALAQLGAAIEVLRGGETDTIVRTARVLDLPRLEACTGPVERLGSDDAHVDAETAAADADLARVAVLERAAKLSQATEEVQALLSRLPVGHTRRGVALRQLARLHWERGDRDATLRVATEATFTAMSVDDDATAAAAAATAYLVTAGFGIQPETAPMWKELARSLADRAGDPATELALLEAFGNVETRRGSYAAAREHLERAVSLAESLQGKVSTHLENLYYSLGVVGLESGDLDAARTSLDAALAIDADLVGPDHPAYATVLAAMANVNHIRGDADTALVQVEQALAIRRRSLGRNNPETLASLAMLGVMLKRVGQQQRALEVMREAVAGTRALGPPTRELGQLVMNLGTTEISAGELASGEAHLVEAVAILTETLPAEHPELSSARSNLATYYLMSDRPRDAEPLVAQALTAVEHTVGLDHPTGSAVLLVQAEVDLALERPSTARERFQRVLTARETWADRLDFQLFQPLMGIGSAELALNHPAEADAAFRRALEVAQADPGIPAAFLGEARFARARASVLVGGPTEAALAWADAATEDFRRAEDPSRAAEVELWRAGISGRQRGARRPSVRDR